MKASLLQQSSVTDVELSGDLEVGRDYDQNSNGKKRLEWDNAAKFTMNDNWIQTNRVVCCIKENLKDNKIDIMVAFSANNTLLFLFLKGPLSTVEKESMKLAI